MTTCLIDEITQATATTPDDIMIACDDLYCDPFDTAARDRVQALLISARGASLPGPGTPAPPRPERVTQVSPPAMKLVRTGTTVAATRSNRGCAPGARRIVTDGNALSARYQISRGAAVDTTTRSENTNTTRAKGEHAMSPSASEQPSSADNDYALVRAFSRDLKIACDELHDNPYDNDARETLKTLIAERGPAADAALDRLIAQPPTPSAIRTR